MKWLDRLLGRTETPPPQEEPELPGKLLVVSAGFEDDGRIRLEVEYDPEFVDGLRKRGYIGTNDHDVVMRYVGDVYRTIINSTDTPTGFD